MPRRRGLRPRLLAAVVRSKATLAFAAERQVVGQTEMGRQEFIASCERFERVQVTALVVLAVFAISASYLTIAWIRANRRELDAVWPTLTFSGLAAAPGVALFATVVFRLVVAGLHIRLDASPSHSGPVTLVCGLWILAGPILLFISKVPARPDVTATPRGLRVVQASHLAVWLASSVLAYTLIALG
jgi:hypothetical protein